MPAKSIALQLAAMSLGLLTALSAQLPGPGTSERLWVAGRYDGDRIVVYFDAVRFGRAMPPQARLMAPPVAGLFFSPVELPANYIAGFQNKPGAEHFAIGDRYDLLLGNGTTATIKLTTLVGFHSDEEVGNDSFVGALATLEQPAFVTFTHDYYAVRRHEEPPSGKSEKRPDTPAEYRKHAGLVDTPIRFDIETEIARLLDRRMKVAATAAERSLAGGVAPALKVQSFRLANGSLRYYVQADWKSGKETERQLPYSLAAWISPLPAPHVLAVEKRTSPYGDLGLPDLLNVVDLGAGRTGIIVRIERLDSIDLELAEYRDGSPIKSMRVFQSVGAGE